MWAVLSHPKYDNKKPTLVQIMAWRQSRQQTITWRNDGLVHWRMHYDDDLMSAIASQITSLTIVYSTVYSDADQRKHQSSASLAFVWGIHRWPVNSPHKWSVTRKMFPFDDVIMCMGADCLASIWKAHQQPSWWCSPVSDVRSAKRDESIKLPS